MKFRAKVFFDAPSDMIWEAREKRFENPDKFPELQKHEELERREEDGKIYSKRKIELSASIPKPLRRVLSEDMMKCIDDSVYDLEAGTHKWEITPTFKTKAFKCTGFSKYTDFEENGEAKTKREIELEVKVNIPMLGTMAEQVILEAYKKNLDRDNESMKKMIGMMKQEKDD